MFKFKFSEKTEAFRSDFVSWLAKNPPPKPDSIKGRRLEVIEELGRSWQKSLATGKWVGVHWPEEYGGRSLSLVEEALVQEELVRLAAPQVLGLFGLSMVGPVLIKKGSDEQKRKFLPKILKAEHIWCQGFSEPGAGSDLASLKATAERVEGGYQLNGQKIWTSFAHIADWCFLLCRTSKEAKKHEGLSYLLVDMKTPGITVRPLRQISGDDEFNEVFFDNVFVPEENLVGREGEGWSIAISTLMYERFILTFSRQLQSEILLRRLIEEGVKSGNHRLIEDIADEVVDSTVLRAMSYSHIIDLEEKGEPGPEGSIDKLLWSEGFQRICKLGIRLRPLDVLKGQDNDWVYQYLYSRGRTIAAGSSEIQRNIIAERLLGLPRLKYSWKEK